MEVVCVSQWVLPGRGDCRRREGAGQDSVARLGATWSAWFFPMLPSLHSVMNGFLLVCGHGPGLKSILTKAQNTHPSQPASQPVSWPLNTPNHQSTCYRLAQSHTVTSATMKGMKRHHLICQFIHRFCDQLDLALQQTFVSLLILLTHTFTPQGPQE